MLFPTSIFFFFLIFSIIFAVSSSSWFLIWLSLEINTISFITLIFYEKDKLASESCFKYFFIQAISSSILIISSQYIFNFKLSSFMIILALLLKLGAAPLHYWFISIAQSIKWVLCFMLMTLQKTIPITLLMINNLKFISLFTLASAVMGSIGGLNQTNLKSLLAFSSVSHIGWMLSTLNLLNSMTIIYLLTYSLLLFPIIYLLSKYSLSSMKTMMSLPKNEQMLFLFLLLSLGGFPPLLGFFPKWALISYLINYSFLISLTLMSSSILNLYFYIRMSYSFMLNESFIMSTNSMFPNYQWFIMLLLSMSILSFPFFPLIF